MKTLKHIYTTAYILSVELPIYYDPILGIQLAFT